MVSALFFCDLATYFVKNSLVMQPLKVIRYKSIGSTNVEAVKIAENGAAAGTVVLADHQEGGQGRGGRTFCSPPGGLYFSLILRPQLERTEYGLITLAAGVALWQSLTEISGVKGLQLKWPNDLYQGERKLGGILTQSGPFHRGNLPGYVIIGVGVNLNTPLDLFPSPLQGTVVSLYHLTETTYDRDVVLNTCIPCICEAVGMLARTREPLLAGWRAVDYLRGRAVEYMSEKGRVEAVAVGLADDGRYIICDSAGKEHYILAGDINPLCVK